jgi:hypothetical protein
MNFISDRSLIDILAYSLLSERINQEEKDYFYNKVKEYLQENNYSFIFLPKMFAMEAD